MTDRYSTEAAAGSHIHSPEAAPPPTAASTKSLPPLASSQSPLAQLPAQPSAAGPQDEASLHDRLLEEWGSAIAAGRVGPGERLPEPSAELGAPSRTVTREVTRVLESKGMVSVRRKTGAIATPSAQWNPYDRQIIRWRLNGPERLATLHELSQLRVAVEPAAAFLAAQSATPRDWAMLTQATMDMVAYSNHANETEYLQADILFHRTLLAATGNRMFAALDGIIVATLEGRTEHQLMPSVANADALRRHTDVAAFIRKGDGAAAREAMADIVNESDEAMTQMTGGE